MTSSTAEHPILRPPMSTPTSKDGHLHSAGTTCSTLNANSGRSANSTGLHKSSPPECTLQVPVMKIGVPGKFHEDRWPRTAEDSERLVDPAHTGSGRDPSDTSYRVAKRSSGRSSARHPCPQMPQRHPRVAKGVFWSVFGTGTLPTGTSETSPRGEGVIYRVFGTGTLPAGASVASSHGKEGLLAGLRHGGPTHRYLSDILAWQRSHLSGLRHGDPTHRCLSGILAWQRGLLDGLRHGDPTHRCLSGILREPL